MGFYFGDEHQEFSLGSVVKSGLKWKQGNRGELHGAWHRGSLATVILITGILTTTPVGLLRPMRKEICIVNVYGLVDHVVNDRPIYW